MTGWIVEMLASRIEARAGGGSPAEGSHQSGISEVQAWRGARPARTFSGEPIVIGHSLGEKVWSSSSIA
ncbi:MAG: hypothetical protein IT352_13625 [Gemmatimonadales bacterium]|nr:hypothetical protein [Gemmatimonadales bacterium]